MISHGWARLVCVYFTASLFVTVMSSCPPCRGRAIVPGAASPGVIREIYAREGVFFSCTSQYTLYPLCDCTTDRSEQGMGSTHHPSM